MELLSIRAYGRRAGKSHECIRKWIAAGMPMVGGKVEPEAADRWRAANREAVEEPLLQAADRWRAANREAVEEPLLQAAAEAPALAGVSGLTAARTDREEIKAKREALKLGLEEGELVPVAETEQAWSEMVQMAKDRLLILPGKLASRLAAVSDELQVHSILEREIVSALAELSRFEVAEPRRS